MALRDLKDKGISRRSFLRGASVAGLGAAVLSYQNCSPVDFSGALKELPSSAPDPELPVKVRGCRNPMLPFDYPFYGDDGMINGHPILSQAEPEALAAVAESHKLNVGFWRTTFYNQDNASGNNVAFLLTVDIGVNPQGGIFHPMSSSNFGNKNTVTDVYVFDDRTEINENGDLVGDNVLVHWHRFGSSDFQPSAMFVLSGSFVSSQPRLKIVARCQEHGYWMEVVDVSQTFPADYNGAVPTANTGLKYAGTSIYRPYVAQSATGGQALDIVSHTPTIQVVDNNTIDVILGEPNARHGIVANNHYPAGAMLYDQEGHRLGEHVVLNIASAGAAHVFRFTNVNLAERKVRVLRAVVQDTFNGHLMGFKAI